MRKDVSIDKIINTNLINNNNLFKIDNNIPKNIYQTYKNKNVPEIVKQRWTTLNPDYKYHLYDDNDCYNFLIKVL